MQNIGRWGYLVQSYDLLLVFLGGLSADLKNILHFSIRKSVYQGLAQPKFEEGPANFPIKFTSRTWSPYFSPSFFWNPSLTACTVCIKYLKHGTSERIKKQLQAYGYLKEEYICNENIMYCKTQRFTDQKLSSTIFTCCPSRPASVTSAFMPIYIDFEH